MSLGFIGGRTGCAGWVGYFLRIPRNYFVSHSFMLSQMNIDAIIIFIVISVYESKNISLVSLHSV